MSWPPETTPSTPGPGQPPDPAADGAPEPGSYDPGPWGRPAEDAGRNGTRYPAPDGTPGTYAGPGTPGSYAGPATPGSYPAPAGPYGNLSQVGGYPGDVLPPQRTQRGPRVRLWPPTRPEWVTALSVIVALAAVGAAVAPLWVHLAPRLAFQVDRPGRALPVVPEAEEYIAADGRFVLITLIAGLVAALACWFVRRSRGPWTLFALAAGGLLGAVVTWRLGLWLGTGYQQSDLLVVGKVIHQPLTLRAKAGLVVEPVAAVIVYLLATGFSARNDLGRQDESQDEESKEPVSSGSA
ncbi:MAG TPA: hypothetical protein VGP36_21655 [Mycobacteriales bacterium]|nr:hypothetical protein [Mycobacteriales bacterium]